MAVVRVLIDWNRVRHFVRQLPNSGEEVIANIQFRLPETSEMVYGVNVIAPLTVEKIKAGIREFVGRVQIAKTNDVEAKNLFANQLSDFEVEI